MLHRVSEPYMPNSSSTAVTCGITRWGPSGMIADRGGTTAVSDLPTGDGLAGATRAQRNPRTRKFLCSDTRSPCYAAR
jgi:hypothetical protein